jgi:hypothetical protein
MQINLKYLIGELIVFQEPNNDTVHTQVTTSVKKALKEATQTVLQLQKDHGEPLNIEIHIDQLIKTLSIVPCNPLLDGPVYRASTPEDFE